MAYCNLCEWRGVRWRWQGERPARCPSCDSFERHRLLGYVFKKRDLYNEVFLASFNCIISNPHGSFRRKLRPYCNVGSLVFKPPLGDLRALKYADNSLDMFIHSHVLEHIKEDFKALKEIHRVLRPGGYMISIVPCRGLTTGEWGRAVPPHGHWRTYGRDDYLNLHKKAGFQSVEYVERTDENAREWDEQNLSIDPVFIARK